MGTPPISVVAGSEPDPFPSFTTQTNPNDPNEVFVSITSSVATGVEIEFEVSDDDDQSTPVTYTAANP